MSARRALEHTDHRPWPLPDRRWAWRQNWRDLLFAHWPVSATVLRNLVPESLEIDEHDGTSWIGVVPFRMDGVMHRPLPDLPGLSAFPELNVRLYVRFEDRPGVWFLSLDAASRLAVWGARRFFHLPYHFARMAVRQVDDEIRYESRRPARGGEVQFRASYRPTSERRSARKGSLAHWLTERYCLYARSPNGRLTRTEVHHAPWPLQDAAADIAHNDLFAAAGLQIDGPPARLDFARCLHTVVWNPQRLQVETAR